jgi:formiminotetrahydrofolate cyclodeaminase
LKHSPEADAGSLLDLTVRELLERLASAAPTPGGGAAAALAAAMGAALVQMTANLTIGRPRLAEVQEQAQAIQAQAARLGARLEELADADAEAYARVTAAYALARDTEEQRVARSAAIQQALGGAAGVPLQVVQVCAEVLDVCQAAAPVLNQSVISDVMVGALLAHAGLEAAAVNVEVNLAGITSRESADRLATSLAQARAETAERLAEVLRAGESRIRRQQV